MGLLSSFVLAVFLDTHSSCLSLNRGRKEIFLPFKTCKSQIVFQSLGLGFTIYSDKKFKQSHPKLRKVILISGITIHTLAAIHNYRQ